jgi:hypothetical protein
MHGTQRKAPPQAGLFCARTTAISVMTFARQARAGVKRG